MPLFIYFIINISYNLTVKLSEALIWIQKSTLEV